MKRVFLGILLIFASEMFGVSHESFWNEDLDELKKIAAECPGATSANKMDDTELKSIIRHNLLKYIRQLKKDKTQLTKDKTQLTKDLEAAKRAQQEAEKTARKRYIVLSVIAYGVLTIGILLIAVFVYLIWKRPSSDGGDGKILTVNADLKCPRCGWKHGPDETICKNCKTHF